MRVGGGSTGPLEIFEPHKFLLSEIDNQFQMAEWLTHGPFQQNFHA